MAGRYRQRVYRLGHDKVVRLPRIQAAVDRLEKEFGWLPRLAAQLPLRIPVPLAKGAAGAGYPWPWAVYEWVDGKDLMASRVGDPRQAADQLAQFIAALRDIDPTGGPAPGTHNSFRGVPLAERDEETRQAIESLKETLNVKATLKVWEVAVECVAGPRPFGWFHGDLLPGNLLVHGGELSAVIDWGCLGVGDPACDVMTAWASLPAESRQVFRVGAEIDDNTWARGRGWPSSSRVCQLWPAVQTTGSGRNVAVRTQGVLDV